MSPFAIRRRVAFQGIQRKVELLPTHDESVFRSFYDMVARLHGAHFGETPQASADAERMASSIDTALGWGGPGGSVVLLRGPGAASPRRSRSGTAFWKGAREDGGACAMTRATSGSRCCLGHRWTTFNLRFSHEELQDLLEEGVSLVGDGLIELFRADAQADFQDGCSGSRGCSWLRATTATGIQSALVVSVDTKLARLWLRLSDAAERCDLVALRHEEGVITVEAIEVKTSGQESGVTAAEIQKAQRAALLDTGGGRIRTG